MSEMSTVVKVGVALITLCASLTLSMFIFVISRGFESETIEDAVSLTDERLVNLTDYTSDDYPLVTIYNLLQDSWANSDSLACVQLVEYMGGNSLKTDAILWNEHIPVLQRPTINSNNPNVKTYTSLSPLLHEYAGYTGRIHEVTDVQVVIIIGG